MTDEPLFPKPEGPTRGGTILPVPSDPEAGEGAAPKEAPPPPGADGFAVETTFTVEETIDNTTGETNLEVVSGDVFGGAEAASPMMYPNLAENGFVIPTFAGSRVTFNVSNIGATAWEYFFFQRFVATKTITISRIIFLTNIAAGMNAQSQLGFGIYDETGANRLARTNLLHVNSDLGCAGVTRWCTAPLVSPTTLKLNAGQTYMMVQAAPGGRTNGMFVWSTDTTNFQLMQEATVTFNGGNPATLADRLRWGWEGILTFAADPGLPPASLDPALMASCSLQNSNAWLVAP